MTSYDTNSVTADLLGRSRSLFADDIADCERQLADAVSGRNLFIVGAAGSIGQAFVQQICRFRPRHLTLVDINENTMVELVRDIRSQREFEGIEFSTYCVDFGSEGFRRLARARVPHDIFVNFSAMKHVRSERDPYSLMRMIDVNVRALRDYLGNAQSWGVNLAFSVSTDKSVAPANLMGATKNLMEHVLFSGLGNIPARTARFANVAFSDGSLLDGFQYRLAKGQPLAAPDNIRRYFISHEEAGQLCMIATLLGNDRMALFPKPGEIALISLSEVASRFLHSQGLEPLLCETEDEARRQVGAVEGRWPCYFAPAETSGEKPFEEFYRPTDEVDESTYRAIASVTEEPARIEPVDAFLAEIDRLQRTEDWSKEEIVAAVASAVPELAHRETGLSLDQRM